MGRKAWYMLFRFDQEFRIIFNNQIITNLTIIFKFQKIMYWIVFLSCTDTAKVWISYNYIEKRKSSCSFFRPAVLLRAVFIFPPNWTRFLGNPAHFSTIFRNPDTEFWLGDILFVVFEEENTAQYRMIF